MTDERLELEDGEKGERREERSTTSLICGSSLLNVVSSMCRLRLYGPMCAEFDTIFSILKYIG